jgi:hypothetical protein
VKLYEDVAAEVHITVEKLEGFDDENAAAIIKRVIEQALFRFRDLDRPLVGGQGVTVTVTHAVGTCNGIHEHHGPAEGVHEGSEVR